VGLDGQHVAPRVGRRHRHGRRTHAGADLQHQGRGAAEQRDGVQQAGGRARATAERLVVHREAEPWPEPGQVGGAVPAEARAARVERALWLVRPAGPVPEVVGGHGPTRRRARSTTVRVCRFCGAHDPG